MTKDDENNDTGGICRRLKGPLFLLIFVCSVWMVLHISSQQSLSVSKHFHYFATKLHEKQKKVQGTKLRDELTIVTAYFNIGAFQKGPGGYFTPGLYHEWMKVFAHIENQLIVYVDSDVEERMFAEIRQHYPSNRTLIIKVDRKNLWSFKLVPRIDQIFRQPGYPRHHPNTVNANYSAAMHAKYEVVEMAAKANPFKTSYFCWLDAGLFRSMPRKAYGDISARFALYLPKEFHSGKVAYTVVRRRNPMLTPKEIVYLNEYWVCGCFFLARWDVMLRWVEEYQEATEKLIQDGVMSTDQQVLYAMFNTMRPKASLQLYSADGRYDGWFHLGYISRDAAAERKRNKTATSSPAR